MSSSTEGGVGYPVGLAAQAAQGDRIQVIGVVDVADRPVIHRPRQVRRKAAVGGHFQAQPEQQAGGVEGGFPAVLEGVALAGGHHVVIPIQAQLDRPLGARRQQRREAGPLGRLGFLAAKGAAHAPAFHADLVGTPAQHVAHHLLHLGGVLGGADQVQAVVFAGLGIGNLAFQIKVLLAAHPGVAVQVVGRLGEGLIHRPTRQGKGRQYPGFGGNGAIHVEDGRVRRIGGVLDPGQAHGGPGDVPGLGGHHKDHLSVKLHLAGGDHRVIVQDGAAVVAAGNVGGGEHAAHPGQGAHRVQIQPGDAPPGAGGQARCRVQGAGQFGQIVDVTGGAADVQGGAFVGQGAAHLGAVLHRPGVGGVHGWLPG
jgi:hypothetical protein